MSSLLKQLAKRVCYNKHLLLRSTSQRICYNKHFFYNQRHSEPVTINFQKKEHEQSFSTLSAYKETLINLKANEWFIATIRTSFIEEKKWYYDYVAASCFVKQLFFNCYNHDLTLNSSFYILLNFLFCVYSLCF